MCLKFLNECLWLCLIIDQCTTHVFVIYNHHLFSLPHLYQKCASLVFIDQGNTNIIYFSFNKHPITDSSPCQHNNFIFAQKYISFIIICNVHLVLKSICHKYIIPPHSILSNPYWHISL